MPGYRWIRVALLLSLCGCQTGGSSRVAAIAPGDSALTEGRHKADQRRAESTGENPARATVKREAIDHTLDRVDATIALASAQLPASEQSPSGTGQTLSLTESISLALAQNPDLLALRHGDNVASAALGVAHTYPFNPFVQVQATPYQDAQNGGPGTTYHYVLLMQTIQLAHQQQFREEGAASVLNSTRWNIHQAELQNVAQTERLYLSVLYLHGLWELADASHGNNEQLLRTLEKQLEAGQATAADVAIVRIDTRSTRQQLRLAKANYETAVRDLQRQLGVAPDEQLKPHGSLHSLAWTVPNGLTAEAISADATLASAERKTAIAAWTAARPDVMAAHSDVDVARAAMGLATASRTPDLLAGPYYQRTADGTTFLGFRAQMDLPVINNGRPLEQQRVAEFNQRVMAWQQLQRRAELEGQAAWERYQLALDAVAEDGFDGKLNLPQELQNLEQQFLAGEVDVVRVVQARTSMIQNQRMRLDLLNELAQSAANLTGATGIPLEQLLPVIL